METAENQMVRFPDGSQSDETPEAVEGREDARLLAGIAGGDQHALAALYRRRGSVIYSLLIRMLGNDMEAQEVTQDAFVQIWRRAHKYEPGRALPMAWIIMIARGLAWNRLRSRSRRSATHAAFEREVASLEVEEVNGAR